MASSRVPTRVSHRRARCPLRCADRSSLRSYRSAPTSAVTSASISPCTKCRTASRRKSPSGNSSLRRTSNKLMLSSATASLLSKLCLTALGMHAVAAFVKPGCPPDLHHVLGHYRRFLPTLPSPLSSPRAWGWTVYTFLLINNTQVVPTRVGVDQDVACETDCSNRRPHARGGGPLWECPHPRVVRSSPRAWGWTASRWPFCRRGQVVPTRVGVDRRRAIANRQRPCRPHARGGGPESPLDTALIERSSPRAWGWTVDSKPIPWALAVVPTRVGVDRRPTTNRSRCRCRPHARGGGPHAA